MHLIEMVFGAAPDGGSGALELAILVLLAVGLGAAWRRLVRRTSGHSARR